MYYEINVSKLNKATNRYEHLFATADRSCKTERDCRKVLEELRQKFDSLDYKISVTCYQIIGHEVVFE